MKKLCAIALLLGACDRVPEPEGRKIQDQAKTINVESTTRLLYQNDIRIDLPGEGSWQFDPQAVTNLQVLSTYEQAGKEFPLVAVVRFQAKGFVITGWLRYRQSTAYEGALQRAEKDWWTTVHITKN